MKNNCINLCLLAALCITIASCKKYPSNEIYPSKGHITSANGRTFRFLLYTDQDFSNNNAVIRFSISIKKKRVDATSNILFDSAFAPIRIKDIPDPSHKIVVEKKIFGYDDEDLAAGFDYEIENVGNSWHIDTSRAGNVLKVIDYNFR